MSKTRLAIAAILLLLLSGMLLWYLQDHWRTRGWARRQETPEWVKRREDTRSSDLPDRPLEIKSQLLLRYQGVNEGVLFLKHSIRSGVYKYDPIRDETAAATENDWDLAQGGIVSCEDQRWTRQEAFRIDNQHYKLLTWDGRVLPTYGFAIDAVVSPSGQKAAVLSAAGPKRPLIGFGLPGLGGGEVKIYGRRYVQVMDLRSKEFVDKPVILHAETELPCFASCWSLDEKVLVSYQCNFKDFQIVEPFFDPQLTP